MRTHTTQCNRQPDTDTSWPDVTSCSQLAASHALGSIFFRIPPSLGLFTLVHGGGGIPSPISIVNFPPYFT
jgi:hypothetical protein